MPTTKGHRRRRWIGPGGYPGGPSATTPAAEPGPPPERWVAATPGPPPRPAQRRRRPDLRWLAAIAILAAAAAAIGSWILPGQTSSTHDAGWVWIVTAPVSGFVGGLVTGYVTAWRRAGLLGSAAAFGGFAATELVVWIAFPAMPDEADELPLILGVPGIPFAVGHVLGAIAGTMWESAGGAQRADRFIDRLSRWL